MQARHRAMTDDDPLPPSQTWYPRQRRFHVALATVGSALMAAIGAYYLFAGTLGAGVRVALGAGYALLAVLYASFAWRSRRTRLVADAVGLHVVGLDVFVERKGLTYPWADISQIRPSIARGRHTPLVIVLDGRRTVDLPVTEEHLDELRRWHAAAG